MFHQLILYICFAFCHPYGCLSDRGEMCAMKEVTLFSDDPKSKESARQLGQVCPFSMFTLGSHNSQLRFFIDVFLLNFFMLLVHSSGKIGRAHV